MNIKDTVIERYSAGAKAVQQSLCCPVDYDADVLKLLLNEIIDKDYGCGDPSRYVRAGNVVLDLQKLENFIASSPVNSLESLASLENWKQEQIRNAPVIADNSVDVVVSNCVLN